MEKIEKIKKEKNIIFLNTKPPYYYNGAIKREKKPVEIIEKEIIKAGLRGIPFN